MSCSGRGIYAVSDCYSCRDIRRRQPRPGSAGCCRINV